MTKPITIDRYPGLRPFDETEKAMFFGRSIELEELCQSINVNDQFVIHGESGLGKSSLINAGLIPMLREKNFYPILVRFKDRYMTPLEHVMLEIKKSYLAQKLGNITPVDVPEDSLWRLLKLFNKDRHRPILIFDQFEEFSYFSERDRLSLITELSKLQTPVIPEHEKTKSYAGQEEEEQEQDDPKEKSYSKSFSWYSQIEVKMIFSLRSDRIALLEELATYMPGILKARYQLKPIMISQAEQIIVIPAVLDNEENIRFNTRPFQYQPELIDDIINTVCDSKRNTIETTQLQMICQEIELIVKEKQLNQPDEITITRQDLNKVKLDELVNNFYRKQLDKIGQDKAISTEVYTATRVLIERRMLEQKTRIPLAEKAIFQFYTDYFRDKKLPAVSDDKIKFVRDLLLNLRLIRDQNYGGVLFYEISHDTLIGPIIKEKKQREAEEKTKLANEEKRRQEGEILKQRKHIREVEDQRRVVQNALMKAEEQRHIALHALRKAELFRKWIAVISGVFIVSCTILFVIYFRKNSDNKGLLARIYSNEADRYYQLGNHQLAYKYWTEAMELGSDTTRRILNEKMFGAFVGSTILLSDNTQYVAVKDNDKIWHLWEAGDTEGKLLRTFPAGFNVGFVPGSKLYWTVDSSSIEVYYLKNPMKKLSFKGDTVDLDKMEVGTRPQIEMFGDFLEISAAVKNDDNSKTYFFSIDSGKPLYRINSFLHSFDYYADFVPRTTIILREDSSALYFRSPSRQPVVLDLKNDRVTYLDYEPSTSASFRFNNKKVAFTAKNIIYVYDHTTGRKQKVNTTRLGKTATLTGFANKGEDVLVRNRKGESFVLYQVNILSGQTSKVGEYYDFVGMLRDDRHYLFLNRDSLLQLYDSEKRIIKDTLQRIVNASISPAMDMLEIERDSLFRLWDPFTGEKPRIIDSSASFSFSLPPVIYYDYDTSVTVFNYVTRRETRVEIKGPFTSYKLYGDRFISLRSDKSPFIYCLNFIDSSKRNSAYLQKYFDSYLKFQFNQFKK